MLPSGASSGGSGRGTKKPGTPNSAAPAAWARLITGRNKLSVAGNRYGVGAAKNRMAAGSFKCMGTAGSAIGPWPYNTLLQGSSLPSAAFR